MKQGYVEVSPEFVFRGIVGGIRVLPQDTFYVLCECDLFEEWDGTGEVPVYEIEIERYCGVVDATRSGVKEEEDEDITPTIIVKLLNWLKR